jgi:CBS domain-containing protein
MGTVLMVSKRGFKHEIIRFDYEYDKYKRHLSKSKTATQIMSKEIITIAPEASMYDAAIIMGEKHIGSLIVIKNHKPVGIVTERDLLTKILIQEKDLKKEKIEDNMSYPLISINPITKIKETAQIMIKSHVRRLAVFDDEKLIGIVTASDLIRSLPEIPETEVRIDDFMTKKVITADENTLIRSIVKIMGELHIGSIIITSNGQPKGIFTERDLFTGFLAKNKLLECKAFEHFSSPLVTIPVGISVHKAAVTMGLKHIRRLPTTEKGKLVGIVTARDLVKAYAK